MAQVIVLRPVSGLVVALKGCDQGEAGVWFKVHPTSKHNFGQVVVEIERVNGHALTHYY